MGMMKAFSWLMMGLASMLHLKRGRKVYDVDVTTSLRGEDHSFRGHSHNSDAMKRRDWREHRKIRNKMARRSRRINRLNAN